MYKFFESSKRKGSTDCVIRSMMVATGREWIDIYDELSIKARAIQDMPNSEYVYKWWFKKNGFEHQTVEKIEECFDVRRYPTVQEFALDHPHGTYILSLAGHMCALVDGDWYDKWDCRYYKVRSVYKLNK